jgi:citrate lyase beta subunit
VTDLSKLTLSEVLDLVDPRDAYCDIPVRLGAKWVELSAAYQAAEAQLAAADHVPDAKKPAARRVAQAALKKAAKAYEPHIRRVWFDPTPDYEDLVATHKPDELVPVLLEKCARDSNVTADKWAAFLAKLPMADRRRLRNTVILLNVEPTVPDLGKDFSPSR